MKIDEKEYNKLFDNCVKIAKNEELMNKLSILDYRIEYKINYINGRKSHCIEIRIKKTIYKEIDYLQIGLYNDYEIICSTLQGAITDTNKTNHIINTLKKDINVIFRKKKIEKFFNK